MDKTNILLADNNQSYLEIARKMLRFHDESFSINVATSVEECIDKLLEKHYHLLLLDYEIDGGKGFDILSGIANFSLNVPVVMMLNDGAENLAQEVLARGAIDYIVKVRGHLTTLPIAVSKILQKHKKKWQRTDVDTSFNDEKEPSSAQEINKKLKEKLDLIQKDESAEIVTQHDGTQFHPSEKPDKSIPDVEPKTETDEIKFPPIQEIAKDDELRENLDLIPKEEPEYIEQQKQEKPFQIVDDTDKVIRDFEPKATIENVKGETDVPLIPDQFKDDKSNGDKIDVVPEIETELEKGEKSIPEPQTQDRFDLVDGTKLEDKPKQKDVQPPKESIVDHATKLTSKTEKKEEKEKPEPTPVEEFKITQPEKSDTKIFLSNNESTNGDEGYTIQDRKGKFVSVNSVLQNKLKYAEEELLELAIEDILQTDKLPQYYQWLAKVDSGTSDRPLKTNLIGKHGDIHPVELSLKSERDDEDEITHYRGIVKFKSVLNAASFPTNGYFDQTRMIRDMTKLIRFSYDCSLNHLLEKISQMVCQTFQFQRATLALLDRRRKAFVKQIMIGYTNGKTDSKNILEVPQEVIEKVFRDKFKVRVLYEDQDIEKQESRLPIIEERRMQPRDESNIWKPNNVIIFNLTDPAGNTFGYISMDEPVKPVVPSREIFHNMEIFTNLTSLAIENFYRYSSLEKRNRRLKRLLVTGNIFKLNLSGSEIMKDSVWSIKFSLDFKLVLIGMINIETNQVEMKAVACDDRVKTIQLKENSISVKEMRPVFKKEYSIGKSYFVSKHEELFDRMKDIYYDLKIESENPRYWQWWNLLIVPIFEKRKNIVGFIFADDPSDCLLPSKETIHTLEIFANQLSIAIENRVSYLHIQGKAGGQEQNSLEKRTDENEGGLNRLVDVFFK